MTNGGLGVGNRGCQESRDSFEADRSRDQDLNITDSYVFIINYYSSVLIQLGDVQRLWKEGKQNGPLCYPALEAPHYHLDSIHPHHP